MSNISKGKLVVWGKPNPHRCCSVNPRGGASALGVATDYLSLEISGFVYPKNNFVFEDMGASLFLQVAVKEKAYTEWQFYTFDVTADAEKSFTKQKGKIGGSGVFAVMRTFKLNQKYNCAEESIYEVVVRLYTVDDGTGLITTVRDSQGRAIDGRAMRERNMAHGLNIGSIDEITGKGNPYYSKYVVSDTTNKTGPHTGPKCHSMWRHPILTPESEGTTIEPLHNYMGPSMNIAAINNALGGGEAAGAYNWGANYNDGNEYPLAPLGEGMLIGGAWCSQGWGGECSAGCTDDLGEECPGGDAPADMEPTGTGCGICLYTWTDMGGLMSGWVGDPGWDINLGCTPYCECGPAEAITEDGTVFGQTTGLPCSGVGM